MEHFQKLAELRLKCKLTQIQVAKKMTANGNAVSNATISKWEKGLSMPDMDEFLALCKIYQVDDIQQTFTGISVNSEDLLNGLNYTGRQHAKEILNVLHHNPMFTATEPTRKQHRYIKLYDLPALAGAGVYLNGDSYEKIMVDDTVPDCADFAIRVSGDSMKPRFVDRQIVFVMEQQWLNVGDIGIFIVDGEGYIKKWGGDRLISINSKHKSITLNENQDVRICGKVVGG